MDINGADGLKAIHEYSRSGMGAKQAYRLDVKFMASDINNPNSKAAVSALLDCGTLADRIFAVHAVVNFLIDDSIKSEIKEAYESIVQNKGWPEEIFQVWHPLHKKFPHLDVTGKEITQGTWSCVTEDLDVRKMLHAQKLLEPKIKCSFEEYVKRRERCSLSPEEKTLSPEEKIFDQIREKRTLRQYFVSCFQGKKYKKSQVLAGNEDF